MTEELLSLRVSLRNAKRALQRIDAIDVLDQRGADMVSTAIVQADIALAFSDKENL